MLPLIRRTVLWMSDADESVRTKKWLDGVIFEFLNLKADVVSITI